MYARVTLVEVDPVRLDPEAAVARFRDLVLPELRRQSGYAGVYVLKTPEGKGLLVSLWDSREAAEAGIASGYYEVQLGKFLTVFRSPPGRELYDVALAEAPATIA